MGSGKGTAAEFLEAQGFEHVRLRDELAAEARKRCEPVDRDSMLRIANELRAADGPAFLVRRICEREKNPKKMIIDSVRCIAEAKYIKEKMGGFLLSLDASPQRRYERIKLRGSETDHVTFEKFCEDEEREMENEDESKTNLSKVMQMADLRLENNFSERSSFYKVLREHFPPRGLCIVGPHGSGKTHLLKQVCQGLQRAERRFEKCKEMARALIEEMGMECLGPEDSCLML